MQSQTWKFSPYVPAQALSQVCLFPHVDMYNVIKVIHSFRCDIDSKDESGEMCFVFPYLEFDKVLG